MMKCYQIENITKEQMLHGACISDISIQAK